MRPSAALRRVPAQPCPLVVLALRKTAVSTTTLRSFTVEQLGLPLWSDVWDGARTTDVSSLLGHMYDDAVVRSSIEKSFTRLVFIISSIT